MSVQNVFFYTDDVGCEIKQRIYSKFFYIVKKIQYFFMHLKNETEKFNLILYGQTIIQNWQVYLQIFERDFFFLSHSQIILILTQFKVSQLHFTHVFAIEIHFCTSIKAKQTMTVDLSLLIYYLQCSPNHPPLPITAYFSSCSVSKTNWT